MWIRARAAGTRHTLRGVGGGVAALGLVLVAVGASKAKKA